MNAFLYAPKGQDLGRLGLADVVVLKSARLLVTVETFTVMYIVKSAATEVTLAVEGKMRNVKSLTFCCVASASDVVQANVGNRY